MHRLATFTIVFLQLIPALSVRLYAAGTRGTVASLFLRIDAEGSGKLTLVDSSTECGGAPSWLTLDEDNRILYCIDDTTSGRGSVHSYGVSGDGDLVHVDSINTPIGPVSSTLYNASNSQRLAIAFYHAATVGSIGVSPDGHFLSPQMIEVELGKSGSGRQGSPHPHDAVLDPTRSFVVFPDLGSDHVRIFYIIPETGDLSEQKPVDVPRGSGPRHAAFHCPDAKSACWMYLVSEIGNTVTVFQVSYPAEDEMVLEEIQTTTSFGGKDPPRGTFGTAEVEISPDGRFVTVSNRQDQSFRNSDSLATYKILGDGMLEFVELAAAGGSGPRQFSFNKNGSMVAVGLQNDGEVAILRRNAETGAIGDEIARIGGIASVAVVIWDD